MACDEDEEQQVLIRRFREARDAGMSVRDAQTFAESGADVGELRKLVACGCPPKTIVRIVL